MKRNDLIVLITEAVDGNLDADHLRELIGQLEHHPDLEAEFHAQMKKPDLAAAYAAMVPRPGYELRLAARMEPADAGLTVEQEIVRFFRRYVLAGGLAAVVLFMTVIPTFQYNTAVDDETFGMYLYGHSPEELISEAQLPYWLDYPLTEEQP
ncbi:MAG: hypothetical protein LC662_04050 [Rhodothermaceae bacterium]|nr:hypothetical protein [Rhodothermaceae bacterium]